MKITCAVTGKTFEHTDEDLASQARLAPVIGGKEYPLPPPTLCPSERQRRRVAQANQLHLYKRPCSFSGANIISNFHADAPYKVYRQEIWYSDKWDPLEHGRDIDFTRSFFDQWQELSLAVPRPALHTGFQYDDNSDYTNYAGKNRNCYFIFDSDNSEDCYYCYSINYGKSCMDCYRVRTCELCYECIDCLGCYNSAYLQDCENCTDSLFLKNCIGCKNCLMCSNLRNKEYHVENKPVTKEQFEKYRAALTSRSALHSARERFEKLSLEYPQKFMHGVQNENVLGDYLTNCKNAQYCFDSADLWDCRYVYQAYDSLKDAMDIDEVGVAERVYEAAFSGYDAQNIYFSHHSLGTPSDLYYCSFCQHSQNLFGCIGLRRHKYCILNKQYTKEEYEKLVPKLIEHMRKNGEWGEMMPIRLSTFAYNETLAQEYQPLTKEEALARGYSWRDEDTRQYEPQTYALPDNIVDVQDDVLDAVLTCSESGKNYRIIPQELALHRQMRLPIPQETFLTRNRRRMAKRNRRTLYDRTCAKCSASIQTTYSPHQSEIVYCEPCYLETVY